MPRSPASQVREDSALPGATEGPSGAVGGELAEDSDQRHRQGLLLADKYELASVIGEGGMGTVWRARNVMLDADVAVKLIRREIRDPSILERFIREARASARLQHPSIVRVYDYGTSSRGEPFMVMELLQGTNLGHRLDKETRLDPVEAVTLLLPIAAALAVAHDAGVVHRDLKPENVFLVEGSDGCARPVIMDFGIAKLKQAPTDRPLTGQDALVGTPEYMSPEQLSADAEVDARSDVWGFCVLLHEVIAGQRPFEGPSARELFAAIVTATPPSLEELGFGDARLSDIVRRGLAKDPDDRWSSMRELGAALAQWAADAGMPTDAAGVTLERWAGVILPPRRPTQALGASTSARSPSGASSGAMDGTTLTTSERPGSVPPLMATVPPAKPRHLFSSAVLAATLGVAGLVLGGWATRASSTEVASPLREAPRAIAEVSLAAAARLPALTGETPTVSISPPTPAEAPAVPAPRGEGPTPASATVRPQATPMPGADSAAPQAAALPAGPSPSAVASAPPAAVRPRAALPASRVPATPNF